MAIDLPKGGPQFEKFDSGKNGWPVGMATSHLAIQLCLHHDAWNDSSLGHGALGWRILRKDNSSTIPAIMALVVDAWLGP